jgi:hypothetical protein
MLAFVISLGCLISDFDGAIFSLNGGRTMGQALHGSATTTEAIRRAIQHSQESLRSLAKRYGIDQKTVAKSKRPTSVADLPTGPSEPKSTVLSADDEAIGGFGLQDTVNAIAVEMWRKVLEYEGEIVQREACCSVHGRR